MGVGAAFEWTRGVVEGLIVEAGLRIESRTATARGSCRGGPAVMPKTEA